MGKVHSEPILSSSLLSSLWCCALAAGKAPGQGGDTERAASAMAAPAQTRKPLCKASDTFACKPLQARAGRHCPLKARPSALCPPQMWTSTLAPASWWEVRRPSLAQGVGASAVPAARRWQSPRASYCPIIQCATANSPWRAAQCRGSTQRHRSLQGSTASCMPSRAHTNACLVWSPASCRVPERAGPASAARSPAI